MFSWLIGKKIKIDINALCDVKTLRLKFQPLVYFPAKSTLIVNKLLPLYTTIMTSPTMRNDSCLHSSALTAVNAFIHRGCDEQWLMLTQCMQHTSAYTAARGGDMSPGIPQNWKYIINCIVSEEDRATATGNMYQRCREVWTYGFQARKQTDRQTYRHADHNTLHPYHRQSN